MTPNEVLKQARQSFVDWHSANPCYTGRERSIFDHLHKASLGNSEIESAIWSALCGALADCFEPMPLICCDGVDAQGVFISASPDVVLKLVDEAMAKL